MQARSKGFVVRGFAKSAQIEQAFLSISPAFAMSTGDSRCHAGVTFYLAPDDARELARDLLACADLASALPEAIT